MDITWQGGWLYPGQSLFNINPQDGLQDRLFSYDQNFFLMMQNDGNLVVYDRNWNWGWASWTQGTDAAYVTMQFDGNLVIYRRNGAYLWATWTQGNTMVGPGQRGLVMQDDRNLVIYNPYPNYIWASWSQM
jgi:hypothetical protein